MGTSAVDTSRGCRTVIGAMRAAATETCEWTTLAWVAKGLAVETLPRARREGARRTVRQAQYGLESGTRPQQGRVFLEFVEQIRDAPVFTVVRVPSTL